MERRDYKSTDPDEIEWRRSQPRAHNRVPREHIVVLSGTPEEVEVVQRGLKVLSLLEMLMKEVGVETKPIKSDEQEVKPDDIARDSLRENIVGSVDDLRLALQPVIQTETKPIEEPSPEADASAPQPEK
jgi:hypothetical protein